MHICQATLHFCAAVLLLLVDQVNLLPVVEEESQVVGVVTRHDILRGIYASKSPFL